MDPSPPPQQASPPFSSAMPHHLNYPDSFDSSPRSRNTDSWDDTALSSAANAATSKLRLMCSYGGHIVPRPHDKSLCYVGGDTRIVVADRLTSLADLSSRLAKTLLSGRSFTLKYQLPNEDLDSLISVTTDEDLDNMIDEHDRTADSSRPSRLRLFLFASKPDSSQSIGPILENSANSDEWFLNALNGAGVLNRGFSDSASVNCLLGLDDDAGLNKPNKTGESAKPGLYGNGKNGKQGQAQGQDVHSIPDSPMLETTSSSGSASSSPSLANLPPIRVHMEDGVDAASAGMRKQDQRLGIEEQFAQIGVSAVAAAPMSSGPVACEYVNRVVSDGERSDHGVSVGFRKPVTHTLPLQPQHKPSSGGGIDLPSPDSVSSDGSIANALSRAKPAIYQEQLVEIPSVTSRVNAHVQMQQRQFDHQQQQQQQQFVHQGAHYIQHHPGGAPIQAYYQMYPPQQLDQQYRPVYYMPARPGQAYNMSMQQPSISESPTATPSNPAMVQSSAAYNPTRNPSFVKPEMSAAMYGEHPQTVQVASSHHQQQQPQQYVGFSQMQYPSQSVAPTSAATTNYAYEYYTQPHALTMPAAQYQTMSGGSAVVLPDGSAQQIRTSQAM